MSLVVEDGSGIPGADSYVTLQEFDDYCVRMGHSDETAVQQASDLRKEAMLRRGAIYIDAWYGVQSLGERKNPAQGLVFPRIGAYYLDGRPIAPDSVPQPYKDAQCEAAVLELKGVTLALTMGTEAQLKRKRVDVIEKEWFEATQDYPTFGWLDHILASMFPPLQDGLSIARVRRA